MQALNVWIRRRCIYSHLTVKSGPAQLLFPKDMSPAGKQISAVRSRYTGVIFEPMVTVVPLAKLSVSPSPAGTVKPFKVMLVHLTAAATSAIWTIRICAEMPLNN